MGNFVLQVRNLHNKTAFVHSKAFKYSSDSNLFTENIFHECGFSYIWDGKNFLHEDWLKAVIKQRLIGIFNQRPVSMGNFVLQVRNLHNKTAFVYSKAFKYSSDSNLVLNIL
jgi:hypothetical protein